MSPSPFRHLTMCVQQVCAPFQTVLTELRLADAVFKPMQGRRTPMRAVLVAECLLVPIAWPVGQAFDGVCSEAEESCRV
jgi:hypothetical protein